MKSSGPSRLPGQPGNYRVSALMIGLLVFYALISWSPILNALGIRGVPIVVGVSLLLIYVSAAMKRRPRMQFISIAIISVILSGISSLLWGDPRLVGMPMYFILALALVTQANHAEINKFVDIASVVVIVLLVGAVIGFVLAFIGMQPLWEFPNPDGRSNYFFGTTFTNDRVGNVIRPAGIYDEPGAFAFVVCLISFFRQQLGKNNIITWVMLVLGLVTLSLAHVVFMLLFALSEALNLKRILTIWVMGVTIIGISEMPGASAILEEKIVSRIEVNEYGDLAGDNRTALFLNTIELLNSDVSTIMAGVSPECIFDNISCSRKYGSYGTNPLSPLVTLGLLISWPYYAVLFVAALSLFKSWANISFFAVSVLFWQRPYLMSLGYSLLGTMAIWLFFASRSTSANVLKKGQSIK